MTQKKELQRNYTFADTSLRRKAIGVTDCVMRDFDFYITRGVTLVRLNIFEEMIEAFDKLPYDDQMLGKVIIATEDRNKKAEDLRVAIRTHRNMVENKWGIRSFKYRIYKFDRLNQNSDETLHRLARAVRMYAPAQLADLSTEGLTQEKIDNINNLDAIFEDAIDHQLAAVGARDIQTQDRILKGNLIYKEMLRLCNIGKDLFFKTDPARYNDYIIYDAPKRKPKSGAKKKANAGKGKKEKM